MDNVSATFPSMDAMDLANLRSEAAVRRVEMNLLRGQLLRAEYVIRMAATMTTNEEHLKTKEAAKEWLSSMRAPVPEINCPTHGLIGSPTGTCPLCEASRHPDDK